MSKKTQNSRKNHKKRAWFVAVRGSYLPISQAGWLTYVPFIVYLIFSLIIGFRYTSSSMLALLYIVPNWVAATAVMTWVAAHKS